MSTAYPDELITDLGGELSNSYCDLDYANSYFANHFSTVKNQTWSSFTDGQKVQALIQSCWTIEQIRFTIPADYMNSSVSSAPIYTNQQGVFTPYPTLSSEPIKYYFYQVLQFPRNKDLTSAGELFIPDRVCKAQCEQAIYLATFDDSAISNNLQGISLDTVTVDKIKLTQEYSGGRGTSLAPLALEYLKSYIVWNQRIKRA